jgi:hypothetical protein
LPFSRRFSAARASEPYAIRQIVIGRCAGSRNLLPAARFFSRGVGKPSVILMTPYDWHQDERRFDPAVLLTFFLGLATATYLVIAL